MLTCLQRWVNIRHDFVRFLTVHATLLGKGNMVRICTPKHLPLSSSGVVTIAFLLFTQVACDKKESLSTNDDRNSVESTQSESESRPHHVSTTTYTVKARSSLGLSDADLDDLKEKNAACDGGKNRSACLAYLRIVCRKAADGNAAKIESCKRAAFLPHYFRCVDGNRDSCASASQAAMGCSFCQQALQSMGQEIQARRQAAEQSGDDRMLGIQQQQDDCQYRYPGVFSASNPMAGMCADSPEQISAYQRGQSAAEDARHQRELDDIHQNGVTACRKQCASSDNYNRCMAGCY
jgi:hypothetical protein